MGVGEEKKCFRRDARGDPMVVMRWAWVVSWLGGGGREERVGMEGRMEERQRKHSPRP